jgi:uncharacterized protein (TIGR02099 family)
MFTHLGSQRDWLQGWVSESLGQEARIGRARTDWEGWLPGLELEDVEIFDHASENPPLYFPLITARLDLVASLLQWQPVVDSLRVQVAHLYVHAEGGELKLADQETPAAQAAKAFWQWLLDQPELRLQAGQIHWFRRGLPPLLFSQASLLAQREGEYNRLSASLRLPDGVDITPRLRANGGELRFHGWLRWSGGLLLRGNLESSGIHLASATNSFALPALALQMEVRQTEHGWRAQAQPLSGGLGGLNLATLLEPRYRATEIRFNRIPLASLLKTLEPLLPAQALEILHALQPSALLHDGYLRYDGRWQASLRFENWQNQAWQGLPGLLHVAGRLDWQQAESGETARLSLDSRGTLVRLPDLYSAAFALPTLQGEIEARRDDSGWTLEIPRLNFATTEIGHAELKGRLQWPLAGAAQADLRLRFGDVALARAERYVPDRIVGEKVMSWLRQGLTHGTISDAEAVLRGPLAALPFDRGEGLVQLQAQVQGGGVDYQPGWPAISGINATVTLRGRGIRIEAKQGLIAASQIRRADVVIRDFTSHQPLLTVDGLVSGSGENALNFIRSSPLQQEVDDSQARLNIGGNIKVALQLAIPLYDAPASTKGSITFRNNSLQDQESGFMLTDLAGILRFSDSGLQAERLEGKLFDTPVTVALRNLPGQTTRAELSGSATPEFLQGLAHHLAPDFAYDGLWQRLAGATAWQARLDMYKDANKQKRLDIRVESDLRGLAAKLPAPFGKTAEAGQPLQVEIHAGSNDPIRAGYGGQINLGIWRDAAGENRTAIHFGGETAQQPPAAGLSLQGRLDELSLSAWSALAAELANGSAPERAVPPLMLNLRVERLEYARRYFHDVQANSQPHQGQVQIKLKALEVEGVARYTPQRLEVLLDRLEWPAADSAEPIAPPTEPLDPRLVPTLALRCEALRYDGMDLGELRIHTSRAPDGIKIDEFAMQAGETSLKASGDWLQNQPGLPNSSRLRLEGVLQSSNMEASLARLGYSKSPLQSEQAKIVFDAGWPGGPAQFDLAKLRSHLDISIENGQLLDIEPGAAGRMVGLLDLWAIPHRLRLDFSDVFGDGLAFNSIHGKFFLEGGDAYTDSLMIDSSAVDVEISGRTGLVSRTYDQRMTVTPHASNALPVAGALVGGPGVGVAVLALQKILQGEIEHAIRYEYTITGSWEEPKVERVEMEAGE